MERFIISDLHLGHNGIVGYRKFQNLSEHDEKIKNCWNNQVTKNDLVFVLGDVTLHKASHLNYLDFKSWNGRKILIMGNHDDFNIIQYFDKVYGVNELKVCARKYHIVMTHIPMIESELYRWDFNMHGHLHENKINNKSYINVCAEHMNYTPQPIDDVVETHIRTWENSK